MADRHGLGRIPSLWWTLNPKYNSLYEIHRLNVRAELGREAVRAFEDNASDVRFDFVRAAPDLATYMIALRTELSMRVVMPSLVPASGAEPYMCMARFETEEGGNPHRHGFSIGSGGPRLGRVRGDVVADPQDDRPKDSDDDGEDPEEVTRQEPAPLDEEGSASEADSGPVPPPPPEPAAEPRPKRQKRELKLSETYRPTLDNRHEHNAHVQNQSDMERAFAAYFGDLVSECNPCCDDEGNARFLCGEDGRRSRRGR